MPRPKLDVETASSIAEDLPDGAYWAMMEELTGMDPGEIAHELMQPRRGGSKLLSHHARKANPEAFQKKCKHCGRRFQAEAHLQQHITAKHLPLKRPQP